MVTLWTFFCVICVNLKFDLGSASITTQAPIVLKTMAYTRDRLISIGQLSDTPALHCLPTDLLARLRNLGISTRKKTKRGTRGGRKKQRKIQVVNRVFGPIKTPLSRTVNLNNLIHVHPNSPSPLVLIGLWNARSSRNKADKIFDLIVDDNLDILVLTESWLNFTGDEAKIAAMTPPSHIFFHEPRRNRAGGGIAKIARKSLSVKKIFLKDDSYQSFEKLVLQVVVAETALTIVCIYQPPYSKQNKFTTLDFYTDFSLLCSLKTNANCIFLGDFNIHFNDTDKPEVKKFASLLHTHSLKQHVDKPTHKSGNILDWVLSREDSTIITSVAVDDRQMSDHYLVLVNTNLHQPKPEHKYVLCRNLKSIDMDAFRSDLEQSDLLNQHTPQDVDQLVELYNQILQELLDKHAPPVEKRITQRQGVPWYNEKVQMAKSKRRKAERKWRKSRLEIHRQLYCQARNNMSKVTSQAKREHCFDTLQSLKDRERAVEMGQQLVEKHFSKNVKSGSETTFRDDKIYYRLLDDDDTEALNAGAMSECEPRKASEVGEELRKLILKLYSAFLSPDGRKVNYEGIGGSSEFQRYIRLTKELQRAQIADVTIEEKLAFFINIYNALVIHANIVKGPPTNLWQRYKFFNTVKYIIGGNAYSLQDIENGVLRANRKGVGMLTRPFSKSDPRLKVALSEPEPLIHFGLVCGAKSCPPIKTYTPEGVYDQLQMAAEAFLDGPDGCQVDVDKKTVNLSQIFKWYQIDFGKNNEEVIDWVYKHMGDGEKKSHLQEVMEMKKLKVCYMHYDWSINS